MEFIPENDEKKVEVPLFDPKKLRSDDGWTGHTTTKSVSALKSEISAALGRLGAVVTGFQQGHFMYGKYKRSAMRIHYAVANERGESWPGTVDIAALPVDPESARDYEVKADKALRMALFMFLTYLQGAWNMRILSPGYSPLMPWMIAGKDGKTFSQKWEDALSEGGLTGLLPEPKPEGMPDVLDGEFTESSND